MRWGRRCRDTLQTRRGATSPGRRVPPDPPRAQRKRRVRGGGQERRRRGEGAAPERAGAPRGPPRRRSPEPSRGSRAPEGGGGRGGRRAGGRSAATKATVDSNALGAGPPRPSRQRRPIAQVEPAADLPEHIERQLEEGRLAVGSRIGALGAARTRHGGPPMGGHRHGWRSGGRWGDSGGGRGALLGIWGSRRQKEPIDKLARRGARGAHRTAPTSPS